MNFGAEVNKKNHSGMTSLHAALRIGSMDMVRLLLKRGANIHLADEDGSTSLHYAVARECDDDSSFVELMLELGLDINTVNSKGYTPLHYAATNDSNRQKIVQCLLSYGADVNKKDKTGNTVVSKIAQDKRKLQAAKRF